MALNATLQTVHDPYLGDSLADLGAIFDEAVPFRKVRRVSLGKCQAIACLLIIV